MAGSRALEMVSVEPGSRIGSVALGDSLATVLALAIDRALDARVVRGKERIEVALPELALSAAFDHASHRAVLLSLDCAALLPEVSVVGRSLTVAGVPTARPDVDARLGLTFATAGTTERTAVYSGMTLEFSAEADRGAQTLSKLLVHRRTCRASSPAPVPRWEAPAALELPEDVQRCIRLIAGSDDTAAVLCRRLTEELRPRQRDLCVVVSPDASFLVWIPSRGDRAWLCSGPRVGERWRCLEDDVLAALGRPDCVAHSAPLVSALAASSSDASVPDNASAVTRVLSFAFSMGVDVLLDPRERRVVGLSLGFDTPGHREFGMFAKAAAVVAMVEAPPAPTAAAATSSKKEAPMPSAPSEGFHLLTHESPLGQWRACLGEPSRLVHVPAGPGPASSSKPADSKAWLWDRGIVVETTAEETVAKVVFMPQ
jgi:hypothetical protein